MFGPAYARGLEICLTAGMSSVVNRLHATFRTDADPQIRDPLAPTCPLACPDVPED